MKRRRLSPKARAALLEQQGGVCCVPGCGSTGPFDGEHSTPFAWTGALPDQLMCEACHAAKTVKDVKAISKVKRILRTMAGERSRARKGPPLRSKPFRVWRAMDGSIRTKREER
jgi:hypothetical protein